MDDSKKYLDNGEAYEFSEGQDEARSLMSLYLMSINFHLTRYGSKFRIYAIMRALKPFVQCRISSAAL